MPRLERLWRWIARADVQTAWITGAALSFAALVPGLCVYAFSASESLEEVDRWFEFALQVVVREVDQHGPEAIASDDVRGRLPDIRAAVRVRAPSGEILIERGAWPRPEYEIRALPPGGNPTDRRQRTMGSMRLLRRSNWIVGERVASSGERVELALPLRHFASESAELWRRAILTTAIATSAALLIGIAATMHAFSPLRRATSLLRGVDTGSLGLRVPSRGTGDPIDAHAETLNSVLARIDEGFARLRGFSSDAAHELRTPLNRISTVSEVALVAGGERELRAALEAVHGTTDELSRVVQALLLLAEIDDRRLALKPEPIDVRPWIGQHGGAYAPSFEEAGIELAVESEAVAIEGDRVLLDRIIANLLDNALVHAPTASKVEIHASARHGGLAITVDDAGPGIAEADRERIFDRFARVGNEPRSGHGVGLALARAIAELHGGHLGVATSPLGGARFELWLPRTAPNPA